MENFRLNMEAAKDAAKEGDGSHGEGARAVGARVLQADELPVMAEGKESLEKKADSFLRRHGREFAVFSEASSLTFVPSASAQTFAFHSKEFKVEAPLSWFVSDKYNDDELRFANHHEIGHFIDMRINPEAYLENFERMEKKANDLAKDYLARHPGEKATLGAVKKFYYDELHDLYNVLDDICVNNLVCQRNKFFGYGDGRKGIETLYEKLGFNEADQTSQPLHRQMIYSLLRDEMLGKTHGESVVAEEVKKTLEKTKLGKPIRKVVEGLKPRQGILISPESRYRTIRTLIEPEYLRLLEVALEEQEKNEEQEGGGGNQGDDDAQGGENSKGGDNNEFDPFGDNGKKKGGADILDHGENGDQVIKDILKSFKEANDLGKMSPEDRAEHQKEKRIKEFDEEHGISKRERAENERIKSEIAGARKGMLDFWRQLIGESIEYRQTIIPEQQRGKLNVRSYIRKYSEAIDLERKGKSRFLKIYDRNGLERLVTNQPERIDVTLLVDCSGSMKDDPSRVEAAKRTAALLMYSIKDFNSELNRTKYQTQSKLSVNTEVLVFGDSFAEVKPFDRNNTYDNNDAAIIKSISKINGNLGGTDDASPLGDILDRLSGDERSRIRSGKLKKIVFEITDGMPNDSVQELTSKRLSELAGAGVITVGFQIGNVSDTERETFQRIWDVGGGASNKRGIFIGSGVDKLPSSLMKELRGSLNDIVI